ncbi:cytochrome P450, partial [Xanthomonas citri pv. citri]|nr:cytochrome P450 [Xanthomonas citri pv. citri]
AVWVLRNARFAVFRILLAMCFGVELNEKTIEKMDDMMKTVLITLDPRIDDYLPLLRPFFSKQRKKAMEVREQQIATLGPFIEQRRA